MAISREAFFRGDFPKRSSGDRMQHPVIKFLRKNHRNAFSAKEIAKAIKMKEGTVRGFLRIAKKDGIVHNNPPYFAVKLSKKKNKKVVKRSKKKSKK